MRPRALPENQSPVHVVGGKCRVGECRVGVGGPSGLGQHEQRHRGVEARGCPGGFSELCQRVAV